MHFLNLDRLAVSPASSVYTKLGQSTTGSARNKTQAGEWY